mmetsp:Transcript_23393/g.53686  ORF Transcript_23393/g.53686 Transcript_23393/m.53686 type:complete len:615 (+) Transcript_23393:46-1890(+)
MMMMTTPALLAFLLVGTAQACTVFIAGKNATTDGSVLVSHSNDGEFTTDPRLVKIPAQDWEEGSMRPVFFSPEDYPRYVGTDRGAPEYYPKSSDEPSFQPIGYIPQEVTHTYAYLEETYGAVNEKQVAVGESTCSGVFGAIPLGAPNGTAMLSIDELTHIAMERTSTALEAVELMGRLAEEYGFYGAGEFEGTAESLGVTDPHDAWIFHILPDPTGKSAIWAAQRVPENGFAVLANMFVIRAVDPNDKENFRMSPSVHSVADEYGWWSPDSGELLDFTKVYSDGEYAHKYYSGRRMWGGYRLVGKDYPADYVDLQSDPAYPVYATLSATDKKVSQQDLFRFHRDTYKGTPYSLSEDGNLAAGPFGTPDRWKAGPAEEEMMGNWERPIGLYRTSDTYVVQSKGCGCGEAVLWFAPASALGTVFTPFVVSMTDIPASFRSGHHSEFSRGSAFWGACVVHNIANLKWSYAIGDVESMQNELESSSIQMVADMDKRCSQNSLPSTASLASMEVVYVENAKRVVDSMWSVSDQLLFKYASGFVNENPDKMSQMVGYPKWWLEQVGYKNGPPPPPTEPKCCHPPHKDLSNEEVTVAVTHESTGKAAMRQYLRSQNQVDQQ